VAEHAQASMQARYFFVLSTCWRELLNIERIVSFRQQVSAKLIAAFVTDGISLANFMTAKYFADETEDGEL
jgi:hypothetical protein